MLHTDCKATLHSGYPSRRDLPKSQRFSLLDVRLEASKGETTDRNSCGVSKTMRKGKETSAHAEFA